MGNKVYNSQKKQES